MIVNGAPIRFRTKSRIELTAKARFLFGKQIMAPDQADSPARRIYFALQSAYIGTEEERAGGLVSARALIGEFDAATTSALARDMLDRALAAAEADDCYQALKLARRIIRHEDAVLGRSTVSPQLEQQRAATMQTMIRATNAYQQAATHRSVREQEADIFRHAIAALRTARGADKIDARARGGGQPASVVDGA